MIVPPNNSRFWRFIPWHSIIHGWRIGIHIGSLQWLIVIQYHWEVFHHNPLNYVKKKMKVFWLLRCSHKPLPKFQIVIPLVSLGMAQWVRIRNIISKYYTKCHVVITLKKTVPRFFPVTQTRVFLSDPFRGCMSDLHLGDQKVTTGRSWTPEITSPQNSHLGLTKKVAKQTIFPFEMAQSLEDIVRFREKN